MDEAGQDRLAQISLSQRSRNSFSSARKRILFGRESNCSSVTPRRLGIRRISYLSWNFTSFRCDGLFRFSNRRRESRWPRNRFTIDSIEVEHDGYRCVPRRIRYVSVNYVTRYSLQRSRRNWRLGRCQFRVKAKHERQ